MTEKPELDLRADKFIEAMTAPDGMFPIVETEIRGHTYRTFQNAPATMDQYFDLGAGHGDKEFIVYEDTRLTFAQTVAQAQKLGHVLREKLGAGEGDRVAIAMRNFPEWFISFMGASGSGCVAVPVNAWWTEDEFAYGLTDSGSKIVIADEQRIKILLPLKEKLGLTLVAVRMANVPDGVLAYEDLMAGEQPAGWPVHNRDTDDDALMLYTSGTTGNPKGVVSTHRSVISTLLGWVVMGLAAKEVVALDTIAAGEEVPAEAPQPIALVALPMFHVTGSHAIFLVSIALGRKLVLMYKWDTIRAYELIEKEKVTGFLGVPTMSGELATHPDREKYDLSSLLEIGSGGAARPPEQVKQINKAFPQSQAGQGYGLTETNATGATNGGVNYQLKPDSTGRANSPLNEFKIVDPDGKALPVGQAGEVLIKTPSLFRCYWNKPDATAEAFDDEGYFRTGDVGRFDEDGFLYIVDRIKDIVIRGGENISCIEVESAIYEIEGVQEVAVYGLPDERLGEIVAATVMLKSGAALTEEQVKAHLKEHLAAFKVPAHIFFTTDNLPRGATGKIQKRDIREAKKKELGLDK